MSQSQSDVLILSPVPTLVISAYGPASIQCPQDFSEGDMTRPEFRDECDINNIMKRYQQTGLLDFVNKHSPQYGDCTGVEFREAMEVTTKAREMFADLPSELRYQFQNDPALFVDFCSDPMNRQKMAQMGLLSPEAALRVLQPEGDVPPIVKEAKKASKVASGETPENA